MIPDNVTLIVKAPNQQIEDQNIECLSSWTVRQLKGHLSQVYPSKPSTDEQKIIYSGQLLDDNTILKDVLRTYESQIAHTMHLVCTPTRRMPTSAPAPTPSTDGLRQRIVPAPTTPATPAEPTRPETRQNDQNHNVEMQNYLSSFANNYGRVPPYPNYNFREGYLPVPNDPALMANHIMMMQQAYLQYMQQYANMWQATATANPAAAPPPTEAPPQAPAPAPQAEDNEEGHARDWLDQLYAASRLAILFSLVYLYGSPARLLLVLLLAAAGYLHQIGFFRDLRLVADEVNRQDEQEEPAANRQERVVQAAPQPNQNAPPQDAAAQTEPRANAEPATPPQGTPAPPTAAPPPNDNQQSLLAVTWMIFTSFFSSLIPEVN